MTDKQFELDQLIRSSILRPTQGCKCLEAMLQGYRQRYNRDDKSGMYQEESKQEEGERK